MEKAVKNTMAKRQREFAISKNREETSGRLTKRTHIELMILMGYLISSILYVIAVLVAASYDEDLPILICLFTSVTFLWLFFKWIYDVSNMLADQGLSSAAAKDKAE